MKSCRHCNDVKSAKVLLSGGAYQEQDIGARYINDNGQIIECTEAPDKDDCDGCYAGKYCCILGPCSADSRRDDKEIYWKKIERNDNMYYNVRDSKGRFCKKNNKYSIRDSKGRFCRSGHNGRTFDTETQKVLHPLPTNHIKKNRLKEVLNKMDSYK